MKFLVISIFPPTAMPEANPAAVSVRGLSKSYTIAQEDQKHRLATDDLGRIDLYGRVGSL